MTNSITNSGPPQKFTDYPAVEHREDYKPAREYLRSRSAKITGLLGLYEYGSVGAPGISDIDLIAVIDSKIDSKQMFDFLSGSGAPSHVTRVLDQGTIKPMSESLFSRINVLGAIDTAPIFTPDPIALRSPNPDDIKFIDIANVIDWLPERALMLRSLLDQPTLSCRRVLGGLGSFKHSVATVGAVLGYEPKESISFSNSYNDLRSEWFENSEVDNFRKTVDLINAGIATGKSLLIQVTDHLISHGILESNKNASGSIFWLNSSKAFLFEDGDVRTNISSESAPLLVHIVPPAWIPILDLYAGAVGGISSLIARNTELAKGYSPTPVQNEFDTILNERIEWINESYEFLNPLGLSSLMYRFSHLRYREN